MRATIAIFAVLLSTCAVAQRSQSSSVPSNWPYPDVPPGTCFPRCAPEGNPNQGSPEQPSSAVRSDFTPEQLAAIARACGAPLIRSGPEHDLEINAFGRLLEAMRQSGWTQRVTIISLVDSPQINAITHIEPQLHGGGLICLPVAMVRFLQDSEAELASVIAHEMGHTIDDTCRAIMSSASTLPNRRICEKRADEIGFLLLVRAGYNPFAAAGAFGRLEMFKGDYSTGFLARFRNFASDHPMTPDRIADLRSILINYCGQHPEACR